MNIERTLKDLVTGRANRIAEKFKQNSTAQ